MKNLLIITVVVVAVAACATNQGTVAASDMGPQATYMAVDLDNNASPAVEKTALHQRTGHSVIVQKVPMTAAQTNEKRVARADEAQKNKRNLQINKGKYGNIMRMNPEFIKQKEDLRLGKASNVKAFKRAMESKVAAIDFVEAGNKKSPTADSSRMSPKIDKGFMKQKSDLKNGIGTMDRFQNPSKSRMNCSDDQCKR